MKKLEYEEQGNKRYSAAWTTLVTAAIALTVSVPLQSNPGDTSADEVEEKQYSMDDDGPKEGDADVRERGDSVSNEPRDTQVSSKGDDNGPKQRNSETRAEILQRTSPNALARDAVDEERQYSAQADRRGADADVNGVASISNSTGQDLSAWDGKDVYSSDDQKVGEVTEIVLDLDEGKATHVLIDRDGVFTGARLVALESLRKDASDSERLIIGLSADAFEDAAEYLSDRDISENIRANTAVTGNRSVSGDPTMSASERFDSEATSASAVDERHAFHSDLIDMDVDTRDGREIGEVDSLILMENDEFVFAVIGDLEEEVTLPNNADRIAIRLDALVLQEDEDDELTADIDLSDLGSAPEAWSSDGESWHGLGDNKIVILSIREELASIE